MFGIEIGGTEGSPARLLTDGDIATVDATKPHTALSDWQATIPFDATGRCHRQPVGSQTASEVHAWYRDHPDEQPTDDEGESFIPSSWNSEHHTVATFHSDH